MTQPRFSPRPALICVALVALLGNGTEVVAQNTQIRGFADVALRASDRDAENPSFDLGQVDLFIRSRLADNFNFFAEITFEQHHGEWEVDVERVRFDWIATPYMTVQAGVQHTPLGVWNTDFHHGTLMQPTIDRPVLFKFHGRGPFKLHTTGIAITGTDLGSAHLAYDVMVGNGIGADTNSDNDDSKSVTARLYSQVNQNTRLGGAWYTSHISAGVEDQAHVALTDPVRMNVFEVFATHSGNRVELMAEYAHARNKGAAGTSTSNGFYVYGGIPMGRAIPYVMVESMDFPLDDPYFAANDVSKLIAGFRWDAAATTAIKWEVRRIQSGLVGDAFEFAMQWSIAY